MKKCNVRRLSVWLLAVVLLASCIPVAYAAQTSGNCGQSLQWQFADGILTITGTGEMEDYTEAAPAPWYPLREQITGVSLPDGLTRVGSYAFAQCAYLEAVRLPDTVTEVGENSFFACEDLQFVTLSANLETIEDSGFERCVKLQTIQLPYGLKKIGYQAFWRCESLMDITVPQTVTDLGMAVFAYCFRLVRAQIDAPIAQLPQWLFYGCHSLGCVTLPGTVKGVDAYAFYGCEGLNTVYYPGDKQDTDALISDIAQYLDDFTNSNVSAGSSNSATSVEEKTQEDTTQRVSTTVTTTDNAQIGTQVTQEYPQGETKPSSTQPQINATVTDPSGWNDVVQETDKVLEYYGDQLEEGQKVSVTVYVPHDVEVDSLQMASLAGKPVTLTIHTAVGNMWTVDCTNVTAQTLQENLVLSYTLTVAEEKWSEKLGGAETYLLKFHNEMQIDAQVSIRIPTRPCRANAFLYQRSGNQLGQLQAVVVDDDGYACFYLGAVDSRTDYFVGINVTDASVDNVIVPQSLQEDYLIPPMQSIDYVITGRSSSWNMTIGQVTWIIVGVLVASAAVVGGVLYVMNKRKLQNGYVPDLEEEE